MFTPSHSPMYYMYIMYVYDIWEYGGVGERGSAYREIHLTNISR